MNTTANNSRKGIYKTSIIETNAFPSVPRHRPFWPLGGSYLWPWYARKYLAAAISNNLLLVKAPADYIKTKLLDCMHVNFSQSELRSVRAFLFMFHDTLFNFMFTGFMSFGNPSFCILPQRILGLISVFFLNATFSDLIPFGSLAQEAILRDSECSWKILQNPGKSRSTSWKFRQIRGNYPWISQ